MDPVTAIGLVAAIVQLTELSIKITRRVSDFTAAATTKSPPRAFQQILTVLPLITDGLNRLQADASTGPLDAAGKEALAPVVKGCLSEIQSLDGILDKVLPSADASRHKRFTKAFSSLRYDSKIEGIVKTISGYTESLTFHHVTCISHKPETARTLPEQKAFWLVPFDRNPSFVGRDAIFEKIEESLKVPEGSQPKAALCGLGGIGKSQVALEYCFRRKKLDERCSVFWCNADTVARFEESMNRIANECGLLSQGDAGADTLELLKSWLASEHKAPWLMVIDNVDDRDVFLTELTKTGKPPSAYIPQCPHGTLLFTTRSRAIAVDLAISVQPIMIREMNQREGLKLATGRGPEDASEEDILELLRELEYIPLVITQALAFIVKRQKTIQWYLEQYRKSDMMKTKFISHEFVDHGRHERSMDSVARTWILSFEAMIDMNPRAAEILCLMAFFQHQGVPAALLHNENEDEARFHDAVDLLKEFSFINGDMANSSLSCHRLVQLATKWWLGKDGFSGVDSWAAAALISVARLFECSYWKHIRENFALRESLAPHAELILQYEFQTSSEEVELSRAILLRSSGRHLAQKGWPEEGRSRVERSIQICTDFLGEAHDETIASSLEFGFLLVHNFQDPTSVEVLTRVVRFTQEALGHDHPKTLKSRHHLASAIATTGDLTGSEAEHRKVIGDAEDLWGRKHGSRPLFLEGLIQVLESQDMPEKSAEALMLQREVYSGSLETRGPYHYTALKAQNALAVTLSKNRDTHKEAYDLFLDLLEKIAQVLGNDNGYWLISVLNLGSLLFRMHRYEELEELFVQTLKDVDDRPMPSSRIIQDLIGEIKTELSAVRRRRVIQDSGSESSV